MNHDPINPSHYKQGAIECIDAAESMLQGETCPTAAVCRFNILRYCWRLAYKDTRLVNARKLHWWASRLVHIEAQREQRHADTRERG